MKEQTLSQILGKLAGKDVEFGYQTIRLFSDRNVQRESEPWQEHEIARGKKLLQAYRLIGSDGIGDKLIVKRDLSGPVLVFGHDSSRFRPTPIAPTLKAFLGICHLITKQLKKYKKPAATLLAYHEDVLGIIREIARHHRGKLPQYWVDYLSLGGGEY